LGWRDREPTPCRHPSRTSQSRFRSPTLFVRLRRLRRRNPTFQPVCRSLVRTSSIQRRRVKFHRRALRKFRRLRPRFDALREREDGARWEISPQSACTLRPCARRSANWVTALSVCQAHQASAEEYSSSIGRATSSSPRSLLRVSAGKPVRPTPSLKGRTWNLQRR